MGFRSLQHVKARRSTSRGRCLPATFRLQGLATLLTVYSLRALASFVSHRQRSWDSPFGASSSRKVSGTFPSGSTHLPFHLPVIPCAKHGAGSAGRGSWALALSGVPGGPNVFSARTAGCSLGFRPSRVCDESLDRVFARPPPTCFGFSARTSEFRSARASPRPTSRISPQAQARQPL
jgi:hypothetical protein